MQHVETGGKELTIVNVGGRFFVIGDRCGHENARLSRGTLAATIVTCPMHSSKFDVTTGKKLTGPVLEMGGLGGILSGCPTNVKKSDDADVSGYCWESTPHQDVRSACVRSESGR